MPAVLYLVHATDREAGFFLSVLFLIPARQTNDGRRGDGGVVDRFVHEKY